MASIKFVRNLQVKKYHFPIEKKIYSQESMYTFMELSITMFNASKNPSCLRKKRLRQCKTFEQYFPWDNSFPVGTGRKLGVLCTFTLRPVSTGSLSKYAKFPKNSHF